MDKLSLHVGSEISLKDFSFSQLIIAVKNLFDTQGIPGLVKVLVILLEQMLIRSGLECPRCKSTDLHKHSQRDRRLKTSIGEVILKLSRFSCSKCGKTFVPFNQLLDLDKYSRKSREFEKISLETVTNQSFRRSARNLNDTLGEAKEDKSLVGVKIKVSSHRLRSFYRISGLMLPSFLASASFNIAPDFGNFIFNFIL